MVTEILKTVGQLAEVHGWGIERPQTLSERQIARRTPVFVVLTWDDLINKV